MKNIIFNTPELQNTAELLHQKGYEHGGYLFVKFPNGERQVELNADPKEANILMIGSILPGNDRLEEVLFLSNALKKEGASQISAIIPYLSYSRQDRDEPLKSQAFYLVGNLLKAAGVDELITLEIHNPAAFKNFSLPAVSIPSESVFIEQIIKEGMPKAQVVAPDEGSKLRCERLNNLLPNTKPVATFTKTRAGNQLSSEFSGSVSEEVIIFDDILDTGSTLLNACEILKKNGTKKILICVTHGLFTGAIWKKLFDLNIHKILTTDSIFHRQKVHELVEILPTAPLLHQYIEFSKKKRPPKHRHYKYELAEGFDDLIYSSSFTYIDSNNMPIEGRE